MPHFVRAMTLVALSGGTAALIAASPSRLTPTCSLEQPRAEAIRSAVEHFGESVDLSVLAELGLVVRPDSAVLVSSDSVCSVVMAAHNSYAVSRDSAWIATDSAVVVRFGTDYVLSLTSGGTVGIESFVYDSVLVHRGIIELMH